MIVQIFGDAGRHARSAVDVASLPAGAAVEVEAVVALKNV
ncbi:enamine deaminase RidA (YjgF/YER057c/UK114 family) [Paraburkholderia sp. MM5477-R1]